MSRDDLSSRGLSRQCTDSQVDVVDGVPLTALDAVYVHELIAPQAAFESTDVNFQQTECRNLHADRDARPRDSIVGGDIVNGCRPGCQRAGTAALYLSVSCLAFDTVG